MHWHIIAIVLKQMSKIARQPQFRRSGEIQHKNKMQNNLNSVGELFAVLPNKRSLHCVLQMPVKELLVIVVISVSQKVTRR